MEGRSSANSRDRRLSIQFSKTYGLEAGVVVSAVDVVKEGPGHRTFSVNLTYVTHFNFLGQAADSKVTSFRVLAVSALWEAIFRIWVCVESHT